MGEFKLSKGTARRASLFSLTFPSLPFLSLSSLLRSSIAICESPYSSRPLCYLRFEGLLASHRGRAPLFLSLSFQPLAHSLFSLFKKKISDWHLSSGLAAVLVTGTPIVQETFKLPQFMIDQCAAQNVPTTGNAVGIMWVLSLPLLPVIEGFWKRPLAGSVEKRNGTHRRN